MVETDCLAHRCPGEADLESRLRRAGYFAGASSWRYAENTGCGASAEAMVASWMERSYHRINILDQDFREVGVGVSQERVDGRCEQGYATFAVVFGRRTLAAERGSRRSACEAAVDASAPLKRMPQMPIEAGMAAAHRKRPAAGRALALRSRSLLAARGVAGDSSAHGERLQARGATSSPRRARHGEAREAILCLVNKRARQAAACADLDRDKKLQKAAQRHNDHMDGTGCFDHAVRGRGGARRRGSRASATWAAASAQLGLRREHRLGRGRPRHAGVDRRRRG